MFGEVHLGQRVADSPKGAELDAQKAIVGDLALAYDAGREALDHGPVATGGGRCTLSLTVGGSAGFSHSLAQAFDLDFQRSP